jgi:hypothetical protein
MGMTNTNVFVAGYHDRVHAQKLLKGALKKGIVRARWTGVRGKPPAILLRSGLPAGRCVSPSGA